MSRDSGEDPKKTIECEIVHEIASIFVKGRAGARSSLCTNLTATAAQVWSSALRPQPLRFPTVYPLRQKSIANSRPFGYKHTSEMASSINVPRTHLIMGLCLPLAVLLGYFVAQPLDSVSIAV